jgi:uncharacterized protein (UPF0332 family)/predicted nucleotidyltransferase
MEFDIKKRQNPHLHKYQKDELDLAMEFSKHAVKELKQFLKAVVLFGSEAKKRKTHHRKGAQPHDIDILILINDVSMVITREVEEAYRLILMDLVKRTSNRIHVTTLMLSNYWELVKIGDPIVINMLRDGVPLIDTGVFEPMQALLYRGRIRPTWESVWSYYHRAPQTLFNSKAHIKQACIDLYWAVIDSAHAALMKLGHIPPSPSHVADMMDKQMYQKKIITKKYVTIMRDFYKLSKHIARGDIKEVPGKDFDKHYREAEDFVKTMKSIIDAKK